MSCEKQATEALPSLTEELLQGDTCCHVAQRDLPLELSLIQLHMWPAEGEACSAEEAAGGAAESCPAGH